ncbi:MAG: ATP-binding protein [Pseudomonadota bacterium]
MATMKGKKAAQKLINNLQSAIIETLDLYLIILSSDLEIIQFNKTASKYISLSALNKIDFLDKFWKDINIDRDELKNVLGSNKKIYRMLNVNGKLTLNLIIKTVCFDNVNYLIIQGHDITEIFQSEKNFEDLYSYLGTIINSVPHTIFWKDKNSNFLGCNQLFAKLAGLKSSQDIIGKSDYDLPWSKEQSDHYVATDQEIIQSGQPKLNIEESQTPYNGTNTVLLTSKVPLYDYQGNITGVLGIYTDITNRKKLEENLKVAKQKAEAASQAKTEFLENMRHDIRTPVAGIVGCAQLIQSQASNAAKVTEFANDLVESSDALLEFLNKVLESIKVASGEIPLLKKKFDLHKLLEQIINLNKSYAVSKNLELNLAYDDSIPKYVIGDPIRIQRIVLELITNALKFTERGQVKVTARLRKNEAKAIIVQLSVSDTGMGIPADKQQDVYTRFKRLTPSYQGIYSGTGLGLSIVKQFMDDLDGEISLQSQPRQGSTFTCLISLQEPLLIESEDIEEAPAIEIKNKELKRVVANESLIASSNSSKSRVLVVEDNAMAAKIAQHVLTKLHYQVDAAESGKMALALIEQHHYALILMDIGLPDNDGGEVTRRIRLKQWKSNSSVPIVGLTAHINAENKRRCIDAGMNAIYTKPLTPEKALEILNAFIPHHQKMLSPAINADIDSFKDLAVLDIDRAVHFMGSKEFVKEGLALLVSGLTEELAVIKQRHQEKDWPAIKAMAHKWRGGAGYCGTRRLEEACKQLETYLQTGFLEQAEGCYQQLIQEAEAVKEAAKKYIS